MKVSKVIEEMKKMDQNSELIIGWWDKDFVSKSCSVELEEEDWEIIVQNCECIEWSEINDKISNVVEDYDGN